MMLAPDMHYQMVEFELRLARERHARKRALTEYEMAKAYAESGRLERERKVKQVRALAGHLAKGAGHLFAAVRGAVTGSGSRAQTV